MRRTAVATCLAALICWGCGSTSATQWTLIGNDGNQLTFEVGIGGAASNCYKLLGPEVSEESDSVHVEFIVRQRPFTSTCTDDLMIVQRTIELEQPLGDRELAGCGEESCGQVQPPRLPPLDE